MKSQQNVAAVALLAASLAANLAGNLAVGQTATDSTGNAAGHGAGHSGSHSMRDAAGGKIYQLGDLVVSQAHSRVTPPGAKVAGGYLTITNNGTVDDVLLGGHADFAGETEVHTMSMENDVMKMRELKDGLVIPAGATVKLAHGGYHLMFKQLKTPMRMDETRTVTLKFEQAGELEIDLSVIPLM